MLLGEIAKSMKFYVTVKGTEVDTYMYGILALTIIKRVLITIHTFCIHYVHASANLNWQYSKYAKVAHMHYFCTIVLQIPYVPVIVA